MLPLHLGMRIRLMEHLDHARGLVKDAEGDVVHIAINPADEDAVAEANGFVLRREAQGRHQWPADVRARGAAAPVRSPPPRRPRRR